MSRKHGCDRRRFAVGFGVVVGSTLSAGCTDRGLFSGSDSAGCEGDLPDASDVTVPSDAGDVEGTRYGSGECAVVLTPQVNRDRGSWEPQVRCWADRHLVLAIDPAEDASTSVLAAVEYLREEADVERVVLVGASIGGEASVVAAAERDEIVAGVVAISPSGGAERAEELTGERLFAVAEDDDERFVEATNELHDGASEPKELATYDGSEHGQGLFESAHGDDLLDRIDELIERACT